MQTIQAAIERHLLLLKIVLCFLPIVIITATSIRIMNLMPKPSVPSVVLQLPVSPVSIDPKPKQYEFPAGSRTLLPKYRFVALYGSPGDRALGILGEQDAQASMQRAKDLAQTYTGLTSDTIYPSLEIIATIASASATSNGDYSREVDIAVIKPWVELAKQEGVYIILDLQPGRTDFLTQAKMYEELLKEPHVGLALDPEWRLAPNQVHLKQVGSVSSAEVNMVSAWLADLTKQNNLPQKMFLIHQFKLKMITNRELLDTSRPELAYIIQMDGQGGQPAKADTWRNITTNAPSNIEFGWKNFIDEDKPMLSPEATMQISPTPRYISYQ